MFTSPVASQGYAKAFPIDSKRPERSRLSVALDDREKDKSPKPEEEEKRPGDLAVA